MREQPTSREINNKRKQPNRAWSCLAGRSTSGPLSHRRGVATRARTSSSSTTRRAMRYSHAWFSDVAEPPSLEMAGVTSKLLRRRILIFRYFFAEFLFGCGGLAVELKFSERHPYVTELLSAGLKSLAFFHTPPGLPGASSSSGKKKGARWLTCARAFDGGSRVSPSRYGVG